MSVVALEVSFWNVDDSWSLFSWVALGVLDLTAVDSYPGISFKTSVSGSLIDIVSVFSDVEALLVSVFFDLMGGESVSDDSESASLIGAVFDFAIVDTNLVS